MNLRSVDLNLLVALDALLGERHVTRAADRIGLSQPAMSNALSRLRHLFKDELLVRTAQGMQPTPRALELIGPTRQVLRQIERVLETEAGFDAESAERVFNVRLSDVLGLMILPDLLERLRLLAPHVGIDVLHLSPAQTIEALEQDGIDIALSMGLEHSASIRREVILQDRMVCVMNEGHPLAQELMTLESFLAYRHLKVSMSPTDLRFVDDALTRQNLKRDVAANVPHWLLVPHLLRRTDLLSVMPGRLATTIRNEGLVIRDLPFSSAPFEWTMYWHRRHERNPALQWLRVQISEACKALEKTEAFAP